MDAYDKLVKEWQKDSPDMQAVAIAAQYGDIDGEHHKQWVIDQMLRKLLTEPAYKQFIELYEEPDETGYYAEWDTGIAP